jgi:hypothetical protein
MVIFEKFRVVELMKEFPAFFPEAEGSLQYSQ